MTDNRADRAAALKALNRAIRVASKRLPLRSEKVRNELLGYAAANMAEAYQIGAEEAHCEIVRRLELLRPQIEGRMS